MAADPDGREAAQLRSRARWLQDEHATLRRWSGVALAVTASAFALTAWVFDVAAIREARWLILACGGTCCLGLWLLSQLARAQSMAARALAQVLESPHSDPSQSVQAAMDVMETHRHERG